MGNGRRRLLELVTAVVLVLVGFVPIAAQEQKLPGPKAWPGKELRYDQPQSTETAGTTEQVTPQAKQPEAPATQNQESPTDKPENLPEQPGAPLVVAGEELFRIKVKLGGYTPELRVESIKARLDELEHDPKFRIKAGAIRTHDTGYSTDIIADDIILMTVTSLDARAAGMDSREDLAKVYASKFTKALERFAEEHSIKNRLAAILMVAALTTCLFALLGLIGWVFPQIYRLVSSWQAIHELKIQRARLISQETLTDVCIGVLRIIRVLCVIVVLSIYIAMALSVFPETHDLAGAIITSIFSPLKTIILPALVTYIPNVIFIALISVVTYYVIAFTHFLFREIGRGSISIDGFMPEWSESTYKIVRFLIITLAFVLIFPYLPGAGSPAFQQVSLFIGVLISLGSTGALSHVIAGVFLTYTGAFKIGDRVQIADTVGDVVEKTLLATRIRTIKMEYITIPNALVLGSHIINYSSSVGDGGLILHTTVTIGYSASWKEVYRLLIDAALATDDILNSPSPFVFQTALNDSYVSYEINAYTDKPHLMAIIYSNLRQNIQDRFHEAGIEIMSPHYTTLRDGNETTIPKDYREKTYSIPRFGIDLKNQSDKQTPSKRSP